MDNTTACKKAKELVDVAAQKETAVRVDDGSWAEIICLLDWALLHGIKPGLIEETVLKASDERSWPKVKHAAQGVIDALGCP
jgi:hypothetical protein